MVSRLKRSPEELGFQKQLVDEEGNTISKKKDPKAAGETPPQTWEDRGIGRRGLTLTVLRPQTGVKTGFCYCKKSSQVPTWLAPVGIHETSPHPQVMRLTHIQLTGHQATTISGGGLGPANEASAPLFYADLLVCPRMADSPQRALPKERCSPHLLERQRPPASRTAVTPIVPSA